MFDIRFGVSNLMGMQTHTPAIPTHGRFPVLPVRNTVIFPQVALPLRVGRPASRIAVEQALNAAQGGKEGGWILALSQSNEEVSPNHPEDPTAQQLYRVGTLCKIEKARGSSADGYQLLVRGVARFKVLELAEARTSAVQGERYLEALAEPWIDVQDTDAETLGALTESLKSVATQILELVPGDTEGLKKLLESIEEPAYLMNLCAANLDLGVAKKQELLEIVSLKARALSLLECLQEQKESLELKTEIRDKMSHKMGKLQREALLREQMKTIREELGEESDEKAEASYRDKIEKAGMPEETRKVALDELKRLESIGSQSPESHVIRNYLDLLCALPWSRSDEAELDLDKARGVLDEDHFGLDKIKKRIVQHLAVMKLKQGTRGSILLFVGPPGVGKTSLGESIARALGRKFVRGSLGGVRDDAEIRGHRRTYVGAMPGRIVQGIKRAGTNNPVFLLDEIDKLGRGFQGDPSAALLEVLDPEQNATFLDHYLDVPFDLSKVFFIATANSLDTIPGPLLDRMEVIDLSGYTSAEKHHIARKHLVPKQLKEFGIAPEQIEIGDEAIQRLITHYTRESGVRGLQRQIATLFRAATERVIVEAEAAKAAGRAVDAVPVDLPLIEEVLGQERYQHEVAERIVPPGVVTGLAWTPQGGEILFVEAGLMPGSGKLTLTGQLGEVMKESAQIALSLVRSRLPTLISFEHDRKDIHIHVPAGAIPKDGPSAGVTMLTTVASLLTGRSVSPRLAMTGEITLRGAVTPVGGIKEKLIGAHRAGIERVILPKRNERDLRDVPEEVRSQLKIEFAETAADVLRLALGLEVESQFVPPPTAPNPGPAAVA